MVGKGGCLLIALLLTGCGISGLKCTFEDPEIELREEENGEEIQAESQEGQETV